MNVRCGEIACAHNAGGYCRAGKVTMSPGVEETGGGCLSVTRDRLVPPGAGTGLDVEVACPIGDCAFCAGGACTRCEELNVGARLAAGTGDLPPCASFVPR
ncbi:MAG: hypothetical protein KIG36_05425 [Eubacteriales bacterium]|nr:hypothetical protein [Eubacteriales bacterium]